MSSPQHTIPARTRRRAGSAADWGAWLVWLFIASLLVSRLLQFGGTPNRLVAIWQALLPWQLLAAIGVVLLAVALRRWRTLLVLLIAIGSLMPLVITWQLRGRAVAPSSRQTLTIATSNVLFDNDRLEAAFADVAAVDADIVVMSEVTAAGRAQLASTPLSAAYPHQSDDPYRIGIVVLSRFPLSLEGAGNWVTSESQALTLDVDGTEVRLIVSHPPPPVFTTKVWEAELQTIGHDVDAFDAPTIVAGDLNSGWVLPPFRKMVNVAGLTDAMAAAGHRWTMTWPTDKLFGVPIVTLDHVLVTDQIGVVDASTFEVTGADHRAIVAELVLPASSADRSG